MKIIKWLVAILIVALLVAVAHVVLEKRSAASPGSDKSTPPAVATSSEESEASSTPYSVPTYPFGTSSPITAYLASSPASSTIDTSSWHIYQNIQLHYFLQYPSDFSVNDSGGQTVFVIPPASYFHWPLLDTAKVTVTVASTCPDLVGGALSIPAGKFQVGGYTFIRRVGSDAAAGNLYTEIAYDTVADGLCYHISFFDHGTNGAGFYVSDQALIDRYDAQHTSDMTAVLHIFDGMVSSFRL